MICKNCGREIEDNAEVCFACGTPTANANADAVYTLADPAPEQTSAEETLVEPVVVDNAPKAGKFARFVSFVFALIGLILYSVKRKNGEDSKAISIANSIMAGLCCKMAICIGYIFYTYMLK